MVLLAGALKRRSSMGTPTLEIKLDRINEFASDKWDSVRRSLLYAYAACLTVDELCEAAVRTLDSGLNIRQAILNRLGRAASAGGNEDRLDGLAVRLLDLVPSQTKTRPRIDAVLSHLYGCFSRPTRQKVLEEWGRRGTKDARTRWLKAISSDDELFSIIEVLAYWRATRDSRFAKALAYRADAALLATLLPEMIQVCSEGWIVSRAALTAEVVSEECWKTIQDKLPASYAYLCAMKRRRIGEDEAIALVRESGANWPADDRGLAIWALGQLGMWSSLERIRALIPEFDNEAMQKAAERMTRSTGLCPIAVGLCMSNRARVLIL
jgi:hypothetical protein